MALNIDHTHRTDASSGNVLELRTVNTTQGKDSLQLDMQKEGWQVPDRLVNSDPRTLLEEGMAVWYLEYETSDITIWVSRGNEMPEISSFGGGEETLEV